VAKPSEVSVRTAPADPALPAPGTYEIDPPHTFVYFKARHDIVGTVRGRFDRIAGTITVAPDQAACSLDISIDAASISTQNGIRDEDLRGPACFDVKNFAMIRYEGRGISRVSEESWSVNGTLTIRDLPEALPAALHFQRDSAASSRQTCARGL
jgi:polyisoprenoid-binding protein YceI